MSVHHRIDTICVEFSHDIEIKIKLDVGNTLGNIKILLKNKVVNIDMIKFTNSKLKTLSSYRR